MANDRWKEVTGKAKEMAEAASEVTMQFCFHMPASITGLSSRQEFSWAQSGKKTSVKGVYKMKILIAGLQGVFFNDLRHTLPALWLLRDAKPKVISEALGYSSVTFTMDTHSHIIEGMQSDAMALLDGVLPPSENGISGKITPI